MNRVRKVFVCLLVFRLGTTTARKEHLEVKTQTMALGEKNQQPIPNHVIHQMFLLSMTTRQYDELITYKTPSSQNKQSKKGFCLFACFSFRHDNNKKRASGSRDTNDDPGRKNQQPTPNHVGRKTILNRLQLTPKTVLMQQVCFIRNMIQESHGFYELYEFYEFLHREPTNLL